MLVKVSDPPAAPAACGLKVTVNDALWPTGIVTGREMPLILKAELFELAALTVTFAPLAFKWPVAVPLAPTTTLPRPSVAGLTVNCPAATAPVPERAIFKVGLDAFEVIATFPLTVPAEAGVKETLKLVL